MVGGDVIVSMLWPFCLIFSVALTFRVGKIFSDGAKVLLWLVLCALLTLASAYPVISWKMSDQLEAEAEARRATTEMAPSSRPRMSEKAVAERTSPALPEAAPNHSTDGK